MLSAKLGRFGSIGKWKSLCGGFAAIDTAKPPSTILFHSRTPPDDDAPLKGVNGEGGGDVTITREVLAVLIYTDHILTAPV